MEFFSRAMLMGLFSCGGVASRLEQIMYSLPGILFAITLHEWAHAFAANKMGDPTARNEGRLTINPLAHIDPIGFLMMFIVGFGWAKPVPVNPRNYRNYRKGEIVVSLAGVTMNIILALVSALVMYTIIFISATSNAALTSGVLSKIIMMLSYSVMINCCLFVFNLLPIFPLDGYHVAEVLLAKRLGPKPFMFLRNYGRFILIGIILLGAITGFSIIGIAAGWIQQGIFFLMNSLFTLFL